MSAIRNMTKEEIQSRTGRFNALQPMSTAKDLAWVPQAAMDIVFARKLMPVVLEETKNPFGHQAPIYGAAGMSLHVSVCPPGQGPCLHSHNSTYETFLCLEGKWEFSLGDEGQEKVVLEKWDVFSCPPNVYRGFRNIDSKDSVLLTIISGPPNARDDVSCPPVVAEQLLQHGEKVLEAMKKIAKFDERVAQ